MRQRRRMHGGRLWSVVGAARRGQSTLEYAVLISVIAAAVLGMAMYARRGISARLRESADSMGSQFSPDGYKSKYTTTSTSIRDETLKTTGVSRSEIAGTPDVTERKADQDEEVAKFETSIF